MGEGARHLGLPGRIPRRIRKNDKIVLVGDLNDQVRFFSVDVVARHFGVRGVDETGKRLFQLCSKRKVLS